MALTNNILIAYNDFAQAGSVYSNDTPMAAGYPLSNALLTDLYNPAVFAPTAQGIITVCFDLGATRGMNLLALLKHNIQYTGKWRAYLNALITDPLGQEYDSGWVNAIPPQPGFGALAWGQFQWGDSIPEYNLGTYNRHAYLPLPTTVVARYVTLSFDCPSNTAPLQFFRFWASLGYQPSVNIMYGADITTIDVTKVVEAASGTRQYGDRVQRRQLNFGFDMLPRSEMLYNIVGGIYLASGISVPVIAMLEPNDPANFYIEAVYGNLKQLEKAVYGSYGQWNTLVGVEEAV